MTKSDARLIKLLAEWDDHRARDIDLTPEQLFPDDGDLREALIARMAERRRFLAAFVPPTEPAVSLAAPSPMPTLPGYEVQEVLGYGGMVVVYRARNLRLKRIVALKMILGGPHARPDQVERFRVEAEAIARVQHPHIVQIFEVGDHEGRPFLALEYLAGGSLAKSLAGTPQPPAGAARLVATLARAVHAAHLQGVIHRDLKPSNVLLAADGTPKIVDFGLAKQLDSDSGQTYSGQVMGTPSYISPEQAGGRVNDIGTATDVYALGAVLYELLTGRVPFRGTCVSETLEQVRTQEPVPPGRLQAKSPRDLETICLKCLEKDPARRYRSAEALAVDLGWFLEGRPIAARRIGLHERGWRWCKRRPALASSLVSLFVAILGGLVGMSWLWSVALDERDKAKADFHLARQAVDDNLTKVSETRLLHEPGMQPLRKELLESSLKYFREFLRRSGGDPTLRAELAQAHLRAGDVTRQIDSKAEALKHYETARGLYGELVTSEPGVVEHRAELARTSLECGKLMAETGRPEAAERAYAESIAQWRGLVARHPTVGRYREKLGAALSSLVSHHQQFGDAEGAKREVESVEAFSRRLVAEHPNIAGYRVALANHSLNAGQLYRDLGDPQAGMRSFRRAIEQWHELSRAAPADAGLRHDEARSHCYLGALQREAGDLAGAGLSLGAARTIWEPLVASNARVADFRDGLARCYSQLGLLERDRGNPEVALRFHGEVIAHREQIARHQPDWGANTLMLGLASCCCGQVLIAQGRPDEAKARFDEASGLFRDALARNPDDPLITNELIHLLADCAEARSRDPARAVLLAEQAVRRFPRSGWTRSLLALGRYRVGEPGAAIRELEVAMDLQSGGQAFDWFLMALAHGQEGRKDEARSWYDRAAEWRGRNRPNDVMLRRLGDEAADLLGIAR